ncbi:thiol-activated cytolysin family protein [Streptomyces sirii]|uniref:thiol-activated cytolysin family protein n=1 Tax=Streptomyces sirii TaxID=3127701 RepID=UPI003D36ED00
MRKAAGGNNIGVKGRGKNERTTRGGATEDAKDEGGKLKITKYLQGFPELNDNADYRSLQGESLKGSKEISSRDGKRCYEATYELSAVPSKFVAYGMADSLWSGQFIQGKSLKEGDDIHPLVISKRAPITLTTNFHGSGSAQIKVDNPSNSEVKKALTKGLANDTIKYSPSLIDLRTAEVDSDTQAALDLGMTTSMFGTAFSASVNANRKQNKHMLAGVVVLNAYGISVDKARPADWFKGDQTEAELKNFHEKDMNEDNPPLYVGEVSYGVMIAFTATTAGSVTDLKSALSASSIGTTGTIDAKYKKTLQESDLHVSVFGGSATGAINDIKDGKLDEFLKHTSEKAEPAQFVPLSYRLYNPAPILWIRIVL